MVGELFYIPDINILHKFEGHPHYYRLEPLIVSQEGRGLISTYAYIFQHPRDLDARSATLIVDGDYREEDWLGPDFNINNFYSSNRY